MSAAAQQLLKQHQDMLADADASRRLAEKFMQPAREFQESMRLRQLQLDSIIDSPILRGMQTVEEQIRQHWGQTNHIIEAFREMRLGDLRQDWERNLKALAPHAEELGRRGWTLPVRGGLTEVRYWAGELSEDQVDDAWLAHYEADGGREFDLLVGALMEREDGFLEPWRPYLEGAVLLYCSGPREAAIPALLATFEGAFAAVTKSSHRPDKIRRLAVEFCREEDSAVHYLCWCSLVGFTNAVFGDHPYSEDPPPGVNRHLVQHGRALPPRPQVDCLRLFQALETIQLVAWTLREGAPRLPAG
jgi:hypothetical protein